MLVPLPIGLPPDDIGPEGRGEENRGDIGQRRGDLVGLELEVRALIEEEMADARAHMLEEGQRQPDPEDVADDVAKEVLKAFQ